MRRKPAPRSSRSIPLSSPGWSGIGFPRWPRAPCSGRSWPTTSFTFMSGATSRSSAESSSIWSRTTGPIMGSSPPGPPAGKRSKPKCGRYPGRASNAARFGTPEFWGFQPPSWKGLGAAHMILAAEQGEFDVLWQSGGNFLETLPEPDRVRRALSHIGLRIHQDIVVSSTMLEDPADLVVLLPSRTRYEQRGGGTETSSERRIIYSPEIRGPRPGEARDEWEIPVLVARALDPARAGQVFSWRDTQDIRDEIDRICPTYKGIAELRKKGDNIQYGGPRLLANRFGTPDHKGHFTPVDLPEETIPAGRFSLTTRRGQPLNTMVGAGVDPLIRAARNKWLMAPRGAGRLRLEAGDVVVLRNELGQYRGRVVLARVKPGSLQVYWPEANALIPAGRLDPSGMPDYNATVEVIPACG